MDMQTGIRVKKKQESSPLIKNIREPKFLLMYAPQRFNLRFGAVKPEASLGNLYLAGALRDAGFQVNILDCCLGNERYSLEQSFYRQIPLQNGMVRIGMAPEDILREVAEYDVIGISSIFTPQTYMVEEILRLISQAYPEKLIIMGGINARTQTRRFFDAGAHLICLSEAEQTVVEIGDILRKGSRDFSGVSGISFIKDGRIQINQAGHIEDNLDLLPIPARDLLPLDRIWEIARPHGGVLTVGQLDKPLPYGSLQTSRGCPYVCTFCHISGEQKGADTGYIGKFRFQSVERVEKELASIKNLGIEDIYIEDDSLLARKKRALNLFRMMIKFGFNLGDVNGINLSHLHKNEGGRIVIDEEMLETMAEAGFKRLSFPVESGSQRVVDKWASGKINHENYDISALIRKANSLGITVSSCYLIGYPDETYEELLTTILVAKKHMDAGSEYVNFTIVTPFPGTALYDHAVQNDLLLPGVEIADLDWLWPSMKTLMDPKYIEFVSRKAWEYLNKPERIEIIRSMAPGAE
ncbi:MAG: B12-binding domain-containing radical SAM protein [Candidatus Yanofskybacteria bacterium]|nr:B12-binding domain-containing radical SAM protein [Candidatus Yanofskybacteria bacterium]